MTTDEKKSDSRLAKHLQILDLEQAGFKDSELKAEIEGIAAMQPPALDLGETQSTSRNVPVRRNSVWYGVAAVAMAAMVAFVVYLPREEEDGFRVKGHGSVRIYSEIAGKVSEWDKKTPLPSGSRIRIEFKATEDVIAYLGVIGRDQSDLLPVGMIWERKLSIAKGDIGRTDGSLELTGVDDGETILAVTCPLAQVKSDIDSFAQFWVRAKNASKDNLRSFEGCTLEAVALR